MIDLTAYITQKDAERDLHYCPCCKDRVDADNMDLGSDWKHSDQMRARYGAVCCRGCTDSHFLTEDGVMVHEDIGGFNDGDGYVWSTQEKADESDKEAAEVAADRRAMSGWR